MVDGHLELADRPTPEPALDEVLVEVMGAGVNRADLLQRAGRYPAPPGAPEDVPGLEFAGRVSAIGPLVQRLRPDTYVFGILGGGGHATHVLTRESLCARLPKGLDPVVAGGVPEVFVTAHDAMLGQAGLRPGERVLIHGVGSGVGTAAVQLARALGAVTLGTSRTEDKLRRAADLGLDKGVLAGEDMAEQIGEVDVVIDLVGGSYVGLDVAVCAPKGRIIVVGLLAGSEAQLDIGTIMRKRLTLRGTVLRTRPLHEKALATEAFAREVVPLFERGTLRPVVADVMPLEQATDAYDLVRSNSIFGKVILRPGG
ncbi:MAG TPA: NAD(P)H-quinone oxidoreductase [Actinomycetota bacterium]|nr:NAD(P)H-quinone oxidoreductase [Actinomycetota bacterium]